MKLWERNFLKELSALFLLVCGAGCFLFILIDLSAHTQFFHPEHFSLFGLMRYYLARLASYAPMLITVALLLSALKVLTTAMQRNECVALLASGLSSSHLMRPFLLFGMGCTLFLYLNFQWFTPLAFEQITRFEEEHLTRAKEREGHGQVLSLRLKGGSTLLYLRFNPVKERFEEVFWIEDLSTLYRMSALYPRGGRPYGEEVDLLEREVGGELRRTAHFAKRSFPEITFDRASLTSALLPWEWQSLTQLITGLHKEGGSSTFTRGFAHLCYKLTLPLTCCIIVLFLPQAIRRFSRRPPLFLIYAGSLFGLIAYFALEHSAMILAENGLVAPWIALPLLPLALTFFGGVLHVRA